MTRKGWAVATLIPLLAACTAAGSAGSSAGSSATTTATSDVPLPTGPGPCGGMTSPARYDHVIWIVMENKAPGAALGKGATATDRLAADCARATDYHAITHPSLPNYLALTSGSTHGVTDDAAPAQHPIAGGSIFSEVAAAGLDWRTYAEGMPGACTRSSTGTYATKHNPALYYTELASTCPTHDVPLGSVAAGPLATALRDGDLPAFSLVVPDLCDDTHDCPVSAGDRWLGRWIGAITASATYRAGRTAVFVTWDEDDRAHGNTVALVVLAAAIRPGTVVTTPGSHLALLRTAEDLLGLPSSLVPGQPSLRAAFGL